jgi:hypothetical protein
MDDKEFIKQKVIKAIKLRAALIKDMQDLGIKSLWENVPKLNHYNSAKQYTSLVIAYSNRYPEKIYTPIGYINITTSDTVYATNKNSSTQTMNLITSKYGFELAYVMQTYDFGSFGPWYSEDGEIHDVSSNLNDYECEDIYEEALQEAAYDSTNTYW